MGDDRPTGPSRVLLDRGELRFKAQTVEALLVGGYPAVGDDLPSRVGRGLISGLAALFDV